MSILWAILVLSVVLVPATGGALGELSLSPVPVVLWHGMGDTCCAGILVVKERIEAVLPGVFVHSIMVGPTLDSDQRAGFFGRVNEQVDSVCSSLSAMPELSGGVNAVGFSQGGLFLRGLVQRCPALSVRTLVTMGSPHGGVTAAPGCPAGANGAFCGEMRRLLESGAYSRLVRDSLVQAQYYRDKTDLPAYLQFSGFLADANNERQQKSSSYRTQLSSLQRLVLFRFSNDTTVEPRDSAWFSMQNGDELVPLSQLPLYTEDWLGLRALSERDALVFEEAPGVHMEFTLDYFEAAVIRPFLTDSERRGNTAKR